MNGNLLFFLNGMFGQLPQEWSAVEVAVEMALSNSFMEPPLPRNRGSDDGMTLNFRTSGRIIKLDFKFKCFFEDTKIKRARIPAIFALPNLP